MRTLRSLLFALPLVLLAACGGGPAPAPDATTAARDTVSSEVMRGRIQAMEDSLLAKLPEFDKRGALALGAVYKAYVKTFPTDTISPEYLFRAAGTARAVGNAEESVQIYDRVIREYPDWSRRVSACYMKAFTIDDGLKQKGRAKQAYEAVIMEYPEHPYAADARAMIENLQYTDEELIARFKRMNEGGEDASSKR